MEQLISKTRTCLSGLGNQEFLMHEFKEGKISSWTKRLKPPIIRFHQILAFRSLPFPRYIMFKNISPAVLLVKIFFCKLGFRITFSSIL